MSYLPDEFVDTIKQAILDACEDVEHTDNPDVKEGMACMAWAVSRVIADYDDQFDCQRFLQEECDLA